MKITTRQFCLCVIWMLVFAVILVWLIANDPCHGIEKVIEPMPGERSVLKEFA